MIGLKITATLMANFVVHNLCGYDCRIFIKNLAGENGGKIKCIPKDEDNYISFSKEIIVYEFVNEEGKTILEKRELNFIDSSNFMASSLEKLVQNLDKDKCAHLEKYYEGEQEIF